MIALAGASGKIGGLVAKALAGREVLREHPESDAHLRR